MHEQAQATAQPYQDWASYTDMAVGDILRRTREYYALSITDVEGALRIRSSHLLALEEGRVDRLPGRVYAIGFVRAYSEFLGLDGDKMVHLFKAQLIGHKPRPELNFPAPASESKLPNFYVLGSSLAGLVLVIIIFVIMGTVKPHKDIPEVPAEVKTAQAGEAVMFGPPVPSNLAEILAAVKPAAGPPEPVNRIVIDVTDSAWVEIRNAEGKPILSRILKQGDSYLVPNEEGLVMDTGNIGALVFTVDGKVLPLLGENGDVRRSVPLTPAELMPVEGPTLPENLAATVE